MTDWTKKKYNEYYTAYMPWVEDKVLGYWGENKTSYTAKGILIYINLSSLPFLSYSNLLTHHINSISTNTPFPHQISSPPT